MPIKDAKITASRIGALCQRCHSTFETLWRRYVRAFGERPDVELMEAL